MTAATWSPSYATNAQLRAFMGAPASLTTTSPAYTDPTDWIYDQAIEAASRAVDTACFRQFGNTGSTPVTRLFTPYVDIGRQRIVCDIDDLSDVAGLLVESNQSGDAATWGVVSGYRLYPLNAAADGRPYTQLVFPRGWAWGAYAYDMLPFAEGSVRVTTGSTSACTTGWGWFAFPETIVLASLLQASRLAKRKDAPFGIAGSPAEGNALRLLARLDPDVAVLVASYRRAHAKRYTTWTEEHVTL